MNSIRFIDIRLCIIWKQWLYNNFVNIDILWNVMIRIPTSGMRIRLTLRKLN